MLSISRAMQQLAEAAPDRPAITCGDVTVSRGELEARTNRLARAYAEAASADVFGRMVTVALPNGIEFFEACTAIWKLGGTPHLVSARMPAAEQSSLIELADPVLVVGDAPGGGRPHVDGGAALGDAMLGRAAAGRRLPVVEGDVLRRQHRRAEADRRRARRHVDPAGPKVAGLLPELTQIVSGPLYHNSAFFWGAQGLHIGHHLVVLPRFDAEQVLATIDRHRVELAVFAPTMMRRIWLLPDEVKASYDVARCGSSYTPRRRARTGSSRRGSTGSARRRSGRPTPAPRTSPAPRSAATSGWRIAGRSDGSSTAG